jgi:hypothetical protein
MPTWSEFLTIAGSNGVRQHTSTVRILDPHGNPLLVRYLSRSGEPEVIVPLLKSSDRLRPTLLASLCRRFEIDPSPFGLTLADLPPDTWPD